MSKLSFVSERRIFPSPLDSLEGGIVAVGLRPTVANLLEAYSFGIFPWPQEGLPLLWFSPDERGILDFSEFHIPKKLKKDLKKTNFTYSWDKDFEAVMKGCQQALRKGEGGTWITDSLLKAYVAFHRAGYAHSVEVWERDSLVGGIYGVYVGGVFSAESMFFKVSPASKAALVFLVEDLREKGLTWMDVQMVSSVSRQFGGKYVSKREFLKKMKQSQRKPQMVNFQT
ncbi:leucyl/phenylalanyl-tRNA--protein transferase [bacterium]|nr:leucyl/phenylalanyl-tRNA--protein transferase [bacterium]